MSSMLRYANSAFHSHFIVVVCKSGTERLPYWTKGNFQLVANRSSSTEVMLGGYAFVVAPSHAQWRAAAG
jgi:hypothetical protein